MSGYELPLVFFTVLGQWAIGAIMAVTVLCVNSPNVLSEQSKRLPALAMGILLLTVVASLLSMLHLGAPMGAYRAVLGIGHSWLSKEVVVFGVLTAMVLVWSVIALRFNDKQILFKSIGLLTSVIGVAAILVSGQVYGQMAIHPLWHSGMTHVSFVATAIWLGFVSISLWLSIGDQTVTRIHPLLLIGMLLGASLMVVVLLWYGSGLSQQGEMQRSARFIFASPLLGLFVAGLIATFMVTTWLYKTPRLSTQAACLLLLIILFAAIAGRMLFYGAVMQQPWV